MVLEKHFTFSGWLFPGPDGYGFLVALFLFLPLLGLCAAFLCYLYAAARRGPVEGFYAVAASIRDGVVDVAHVSLRRTLAIARLAVQEAIRRRVLVVFAVFVVVLLFAGWFLDTNTDHPARLYLGFVLPASGYLVLLLALFLSTFSLPNDIKYHTIYTVVTKPVRSVEIVLGRIIGFSVVGTALLLPMCVISYFFVVRGVNHRHAIAPSSVTAKATDSSEPDEGALTATTSREAYHRHEATIGSDGFGQTDVQHGHWHEVRRVGEGANAKYEVGPPQGMLQARVPIYGALRFIDRQGKAADRGINVGYEWGYQSYIEGGTLATAIWRFDGVDERRFPEGLPLELTLSVFRTYKADVTRPVAGEIWLEGVDPAHPVESEHIIFDSKEFATQRLQIPRKLKKVERGGALSDIDLFEDLAPDGSFEVRLRCADPKQYFGMAQADVYIRAADASFAMNFAKAYVGIWLQMVVVTGVGVMFSTFLSGSVAMTATMAALVVSYFSRFIAAVQSGEILGGGPIESLIRILTQMNMMVDLEMGVAEKFVKAADFVLMLIMGAVSSLLPNVSGFNTASYVAYGFNIYGGMLTSHVLLAMVYTAVAALAGYFCLKKREIAA